MSKKVLSLVLALVMVLGTFGTVFASNVVVPTEEALGAVNVDGSGYEAAFTKLAVLGIAQGKEGGNADLGANLKRAEAAKLILHMLNLQEGIVNNGPTKNEFKDVTPAHWASQYISVAAGLGIVNGKGNGMFDPEGLVKEEEFVAMIVRALEWGPIVGGNYPYGEYAKALELNIIDKAPASAAASRGYAFEVAANALTARMAERSATEGSLTYEGEGIRTLLNSRLGVATTEDDYRYGVVVTKTARMERDYKSGQFEASGINFIFKGDDFEATEVLGDFVNVWFKQNRVTKENEVIYLEKNANFRKEVGIVEEVKGYEIKLENGRTYNAGNTIVYRDNVGGMPKVGDLATITVSRDNKAAFIDAFDITIGDRTDTLDLVSKVVKVDDNRFEFENQTGVKRIISDEKLIVYKNGKIATTKDIEELDFVKAIGLTGQARTTFVLVLGEKAEGELSKVKLDATKSNNKKVLLEVEEEEYFADTKNFVVIEEDFKDESTTYNNANDLAEALKEFVKDEVVLVSIAGKVKALVVGVEPKEINTGLLMAAGLDGRYNDTGYLKLLDGNNEDLELSITGDPSEPIYTFDEISFRWAQKTKGELDIYPNVKSGNLLDPEKVTLFYSAGAAFVKSGKVVAGTIEKNLDLYTNAYEEFVSVGKGVLETKAGATKKFYNITDSTVFFTLNKDQDDYEAVRYEDVKDAKALGDMRVYVVVDSDTKDYKTPTADVVVVTRGYFELETETEYGIVTWSQKRGDEYRYSIWNGEEEVDYVVTDTKEVLVKAGNAVTFQLTGKVEDGLEVIEKVVEGDLATLKGIVGNRYTLEIDGEVDPYLPSRDGLIVQNEDMYDSDYEFEVSVVIVKDQLKALNYLGRKGLAGGESTSYNGLEVRKVENNEITVREAGRYVTYFVKKDARDLLGTLVDDGNEVSFKVDQYGDIVAFTYVGLNGNVTGDVTIGEAHKGLVVEGLGKGIDDITIDNLDVEADNVTVRHLKVSTGKAVTVAEGVNNFTAVDTNFDELTLNGGGTNSVHLNNVKVKKITVNAAVRVVLDKDSKVATGIAVAMDGAKIEIAKGAEVAEIDAGGTDVEIVGEADDYKNMDKATYTQEVTEVTVNKAVYDDGKVTITFEVTDQTGAEVEDIATKDVKVSQVLPGKTVVLETGKVTVFKDNNEEVPGKYEVVVSEGLALGDKIIVEVKGVKSEEVEVPTPTTP